MIYFHIFSLNDSINHCSFLDHQRDPDFCIVARVEAFIAGWGLEEALKRAEAYRAAGADAILMHSKRSDANEIEAFVKAWDNKVSFKSCFRANPLKQVNMIWLNSSC